jgi:hypothetical protein
MITYAVKIVLIGDNVMQIGFEQEKRDCRTDYKKSSFWAAAKYNDGNISDRRRVHETPVFSPENCQSKVLGSEYRNRLLILTTMETNTNCDVTLSRFLRKRMGVSRYLI